MHTNPSFNHQSIRGEMTKWLQAQPWDLWATYTFEDRFSESAARRAYERHYDRIQSKFDKSIPVFWVMEPNPASEHVHIHSMLGGVSDVPRSAKRMFEDWTSHDGHGVAHFEQYEEDKGVNYYLTKYIIQDKFHEADWDIRNFDKFPESKG